VVTKTEMENYDAPESQQDVKESLWNDRTSTADFELICDNKTFPCHKIVLACRSGNSLLYNTDTDLDQLKLT